jgi:hypothetical protein
VVRRVARREAHPLEVLPASVDSYEFDAREFPRLQSDLDLQARVRATWASLQYPTQWPYYDQLHVDGDDVP